MEWCREFYFAGPLDSAWDRLRSALAPMGVVVTSEDFHTLSVTRQSRTVDVRFHLAVRSVATDELSVLEMKRRHHWRFRFSGDRPPARPGLEALTNEVVDVITGLGYRVSPPLPTLTGSIRYVEFRRALKGYDVGQVDVFLESLAVTVAGGGALFAEDVISHEFRTSWKGYHKEEVDEFLNLLASELRQG